MTSSWIELIFTQLPVVSPFTYFDNIQKLNLQRLQFSLYYNLCSQLLSSIHVHVFRVKSLTKFRKKKKKVPIIANFTRDKNKFVFHEYEDRVNKPYRNCFVLFIRSFWNVTDRRSERYAAVLQRSYRINESPCCPIDSPFAVHFFWTLASDCKKKKKQKKTGVREHPVGGRKKKKKKRTCSISRRIRLSTPLVKSILRWLRNNSRLITFLIGIPSRYARSR